MNETKQNEQQWIGSMTDYLRNAIDEQQEEYNPEAPAVKS